MSASNWMQNVFANINDAEGINYIALCSFCLFLA